MAGPSARDDFRLTHDHLGLTHRRDVDQATLRHKTLPNIYSLGDVCNAPNAKTAAAARSFFPELAFKYQTRTTSPPTDVGRSKLKYMPIK